MQHYRDWVHKELEDQKHLGANWWLVQIFEGDLAQYQAMMLQRFLYLIAGIVLRTNATILRQSCGIYADFEIMLDDLADSGSRIGTLAVNTSRQCVLQCISAPRCASLNFHKASGTCELLERSLENSTSLLAKKEGWVYMTTNTEADDVSLSLNYCFALIPSSLWDLWSI